MKPATWILTTCVPCSACFVDEPIDESPGCVAALLPGDVVVSEIMADPDGADEGFEWVELYNARATEVDLAGAVLRFRRADGTGEKGHVLGEAIIDAHGWLVLGDAIDDEDIRPAWVDYGYGDAFALANGSGEVSVLCGETVVDAAVYGEATRGASRGFDGTRVPDAVANDELAAWCDGRVPFEADALGTPGARNDACFGSTPATCVAGGRERPVDPPRPGDVVITEVMADPALAEDAAGEWLEIRVGRDLDLNGLAIGKQGEDPVDVVGSTKCVRVRAGVHVLFAASDDPERNGGLPEHAFPLTLPLANSASPTRVPSVELRWGDEVLDVVTWTSSKPGVAMNLDPDAYDPEANDDPDAFCGARDRYGDGDFGSPGAKNHHCLRAGECFEGKVARPVRAPAMGDVVVSEVMASPEAVPDADGEWFELRARAAFDLNGLEVGENGVVEETIEADACLRVEPGEHLLFARKADPAINGGLPRVDGTFGFALADDDAFFVGWGGAVLDAVAWTDATPGAARSLSGDATGDIDEDDWCDAVMPYGAGDLGTPGAPNPRCVNASGGVLCEDGGQLRPVVVPEVGDLVITELMPDPRAVADNRGEWFEVLATAAVDLNGLQIGRTPGMVEAALPPDGPCLSVAAGQRVVFARSDAAADNGGIENVLAPFSFAIANDGGSLFVGRGDVVLDAIVWSGSTPGVSTAVRPGLETPEANDDAAAFCASGPTYGDGDRGTPGTENACE